ncbi:adenine phosphoribosyltransferase [Mycoplasma sp. SG1]|uniref:adenine phosphoribosyltransferase n=1 Tax=Mycoplasma sp. SG1 TaxID=2810348 RepID=UPI002024BCD3|nr:adenine phosphoribosyltransferase [Mycoplasma sp. SG1]URM53116.1 adenine phosphoribosyltransferase [Mycoplasma sp. SG1]
MKKNLNQNINETTQYVRSCYQNYPDFPIKGIQFKDFSRLWNTPEKFGTIISYFFDYLKNLDFDGLIAPEARGFIIGSVLAYKLNKPLVLARKENKLPGDLFSTEYDYEYGSAKLTVKKDTIKAHARYIFIDDVCATGATFKAVNNLVNMANSKIINQVYVAVLKNIPKKKIINNFDCFYLIDL